MPAALFIVAGILCAAFSGPIWAILLLLAFGASIFLIEEMP